MIRPSLATLAASAALLASCSSPPARAESDPFAAELQRLERAAPEPVVRRARPAADPVRVDPSERAPARYADVRAVLATVAADGRVEERVVVRRGDRLYVASAGAAPAAEWLFVRNPIDGAQFTGWLVDPSIRHVIRYDWATLLATGVADSWMRLACMGVRPGDLAGVDPSGETRTAFGLSFERLEPALPGIREVWWNAEHEIALEIRGGPEGAEWSQRLVALELEADPALLLDVEQRFPDFSVRDLADFQDYAHVHAEHHAHAH